VVPGLGRRTEEKLLKLGLDSLDKLQEVFVEQHNKEKQQMISFLKNTVGVRHACYQDSIATFLHNKVQDAQASPRPPRRLTFCVEGNISVGKTTFLRRIAAECEALQGMVDVVPEPIEKWQNVVGRTKAGEPTSFNLLDEFYRAPERYAYTFQNWVFFTRFLQEQESREDATPLRIMERSVFSDRQVFVNSIHESNWMNDMEMTVYDQWFDHVVESNAQLVPNGFIYLRAEPNTCHTRLNGRGRNEESSVSLDYLSSLHEKHETWFKPNRKLYLPENELAPGQLVTPKGVVVPAEARGSRLTLNPEVTRMERSFKEPPECIRDRVVWMDNSVHHRIARIPALILDCNPHINMDTDVDAKAAYAEQVRAFFDYVSELTEQTVALPPMPSLDLENSQAKFDQLKLLTANLPDDMRCALMEHLNQDPLTVIPTPASSPVSASTTQAPSPPQIELSASESVARQHVYDYINDRNGNTAVVDQIFSQSDPNQPNNEKRFHAYQAINHAIGIRGRHNRNPLPAHVENAIRDTFPSEDEQYVGFQEAS